MGLTEPSLEKLEIYAALADQIDSVLEGEANRTARMATVAAMLAAAFPRFLWTGFYAVDAAQDDHLVVGPYQGSLGCLRIKFGRGVCGVAASRRETLIVPDVAAFPGHIACDSRSRSELVVPVTDEKDRLIAVLDIDSAELGAFDASDARGVEEIVWRVFARGFHKTDKQSV